MTPRQTFIISESWFSLTRDIVIWMAISPEVLPDELTERLGTVVEQAESYGQWELLKGHP